MSNKVTLLDGALGTSIWKLTKATAPVWQYNMEKPDIILTLHKEFVNAGSDIIYANTFGANRCSLKNVPYSVHDVMVQGMKLAKEAVKSTPCKVALSIGPLPILLEPYGDLEEDEAYEIFDEQISAGMEENPDLIVLETFMDVNMLAIAVKAAKKHNVPVFCCMTFDKAGRTLMGQSVDDILEVLEPLKIDAVGLNCSLGPELALPIIKQFHEKTALPLIFKPNAGMPVVAADGTTTTAYNEHDFVKDILPAADIVSYLGGCCGSEPSYIKGLHDALNK